MRNYNGKEVVCIHASGKEIKVGDYVESDGVKVRVNYLEPPHKPSASGKIYCDDVLGARYARVYGCKFVEVENGSI